MHEKQHITGLGSEGRIDGKRRRGRPMRRWKDDIKDWSNRSVAECSRLARDRPQWRLLVHEMTSDPQQSGRKQASKGQIPVAFDKGWSSASFMILRWLKALADTEII